MMQDPDKCVWVKCTRDLLCFHSFGNVWRDQSGMNVKLFLLIFEQRLKDTFIQNCIGDIEVVINVGCTEKLKLFTNVTIIWIAT